MKSTPKILIIRFSSIGDIVLTSPIPRCIKNKYPKAEIHFLTKAQYTGLLAFNPYIDKVHVLDKSPALKALELKKEGYDYVIDLHKNFRTKKIKIALECRNFTYKKESVAKFLLTKFHINLMSGRHITDRSLDTVAPLGVKNDGKGLDYFLPSNINVTLNDLPAQHRFGYIAIVIGAS